MDTVSTTMTDNTQLRRAVEAAALTHATQQQLLEAFGPHFQDMLAATGKAAGITVTDESQTDQMKAAKAVRLEVKRVRTATENTRKATKEDALRFGKAVDNVSRMIQGECEAVETRLEACEKYAELAEIKRAEVRRIDRATALMPFGTDVRYFDLGGMSEDAWNNLFTREQEAYQGRQAKAREQEEAARREKAELEARETKLREENARLRAEVAERELKAKAEREAHEAEMRKQQAQIDAERREAEKLLRDAREAQDRAEAEERAKAAAAQAQREAEERAARAKEDAPDAAKLREVAERVRTFEFPAVGPKSIDAIVKVRMSFLKTAEWLDRAAAVLEGGAK